LSAGLRPQLLGEFKLSSRPLNRDQGRDGKKRTERERDEREWNRGLSRHPSGGNTPLLKNSTPPNQALLTHPLRVVYHKICALSERLRTVA